MKRKLSFALILALLITSMQTVFINAESPYEATAQAIAQTASALTGNGSGGISIQYALIENEEIKISGQAGIYSKSENRALTSDNMYGIGSVSKMYTTLAAMQLVDDKKLDLDTPITTYLPEFQMADERYKQITSRMLLNHSSGLMGSSLRDSFLFDDNNTFAHDNLLDTLKNQRLKADPGAYSVYCNDGFTLMELVIEKISGMSFTQYIHENITGPLGLVNTKTPQDDFDTSQLVKTYTAQNQIEANPIENVNVIGTGGIYSTAEELARFGAAFTEENTTLISDASKKATQNKEYQNGIWPKGADNSVGYGLGWDSVDLFPFNNYGITALNKGGDTTLYHTGLIVLPEYNMAAAVLSSGGSSAINSMLATNMLLSVLKENGTIQEFLPEKTFPEPVPGEMPNELTSYCGLYSGMGTIAKIDIADGVLSISYPAMPEAPATQYQYSKDGYFTDGTANARISFVEEANGLTYLWQQYYVSVPGLGQTAANEYAMQKIEPNEISNQVQAAWESREGKLYYLVNERFSSQLYSSTAPVAGIALIKDVPGYTAGCKIISENEALSYEQIPGIAGRDKFDLTFTIEDGIEYLHQANFTYMREEGIVPIYTGRESICTIQSTGYARWFHIPDEIAGKTMTVSIPENASFVVYDNAYQCVTYTTVSKTNTVILPQGGTIAFLGDVGSRFYITID